MDLTMVDLDVLADPVHSAEAEPAALQMARFLAELAEHFDRGLSADQIFARGEFIRAVAAHWPAGPTRPREIAALLQRYGDLDAPGV